MITAISDIDIPYKILHFNNGVKSIDIKFYLEDCITGMRAHLQDKSVDIVVTSPPYNIGVNYGNGGYNDNKLESEYLAWVGEVGFEIDRVLKDNGSFFLNIGSTPKNPWNAMNVANTLKKHFALQNEIHWIKSIFIPREYIGKKNREVILKDTTIGHSKPIPGNSFLKRNQEPIYHFTKTGNVSICKLAVGAPYQDKSNIGRYNDIDLTDAGNTWFIPYETIQDRSERMHPAPFPVELSLKCIKLHGLGGGGTITTTNATKPLLVLDPFCGIGSTAIACKRLGASFVGFEIGKQYIDYAIERIVGEDGIHGSSAGNNNHTSTLDFLMANPGIQGADTEFTTRNGGEKKSK